MANQYDVVVMGSRSYVSSIDMNKRKKNESP